MSSALAQTFQLAEKTLREGKIACDKYETEKRLRLLEVFHRFLVLEKMGIAWKNGDYVFKSGTVTEKEKEVEKE